MENNLTNYPDSAQYFLTRIREFEKKYKMQSWEFQVLFEHEEYRKTLAGYNGRAAVDYSEWSFLYEHFQAQIQQVSCESPPEAVFETDQKKPEQRSGFFFSGGKCDYFCKRVSRPSRKPYLC